MRCALDENHGVRIALRLHSGGGGRRQSSRQQYFSRRAFRARDSYRGPGNTNQSYSNGRVLRVFTALPRVWTGQSALMRTVLVLAPLLALALLTRPSAIDWPATVVKLRNKEKGATGSFAAAIKPVKAAWHARDYDTLASLAWSKLVIGFRADDEDGRIWAFDAVFATLGCTHRRCYLGVWGKWQRLPDEKMDLYGLLGAHGLACAYSYHYGKIAFFRLFSPRMMEPHTLLFAMFATFDPFELVWLSSGILSLGADLQRSLGRTGFLSLYCGAAFVTAITAAYNRHSANGAAGALAAYAYHALVAPGARHSLFGIEMGARAALMVQCMLSAWPLRQRPGMAMVLNAIPILVGGLFWHVLRRH